MTFQTEQVRADAPEEVSPWRQAGLRARQRRRWLLLWTGVAFLVLSALTGYPTGRETLTFWLLAFLLAACAGDWGLWRAVVVRDWLPLLGVLWAYDLLRGLANEIGGALWDLPTYSAGDGRTARANMTEMIDLDRTVFGGHVPTVWLQERLFTDGVVHWYDAIAVPVYLSHFLVSLALGIVLWCAAYPLFRRYLAVLVTLTVITLVTYLLVPAAPPWMAALNGKLGQGAEIHRVVQESIVTLGGSTAGSAVERGAAYSNPVAALPSLHAAIPMMLLLLFFTRVGPLLKVVLVAYALVMACTLVYGGEHYVTDVLLGWVYAAVSVAGVAVVARRRAEAASPG